VVIVVALGANWLAPSVSLLLALRDLTVHYRTDSGQLTAARQVSFELSAGQALGLVGEAGSGKTTFTCAGQSRPG
jgi:ABC-type glutathione transport system ATPase component